jgi:hypothetical protein
MAKKSKIRNLQLSRSAPEEKSASAKKRAAKGASAKKKAKNPAAAKPVALAPAKKTAGKKRVAGQLALTLPLARARKLAGDLYQSAGLAFWAEAIDRAQEPERDVLIHLQDAVCDVADLLKEARSTNPRHLRLYWVASFDRDGVPATPPRFITAGDEDEALKIFGTAFKGEVGRRKPRAKLVPLLAEQPQPHD